MNVLTNVAVPAAGPKSVVLVAQVPADTVKLIIVAAEKTPAGIELEPKPVPFHVINASEIGQAFAQLIQNGQVQMARLLPDGTKVWIPFQGEYRITNPPAQPARKIIPA